VLFLSTKTGPEDPETLLPWKKMLLACATTIDPALAA